VLRTAPSTGSETGEDPLNLDQSGGGELVADDGLAAVEQVQPDPGAAGPVLGTGQDLEDGRVAAARRAEIDHHHRYAVVERVVRSAAPGSPRRGARRR